MLNGRSGTARGRRRAPGSGTIRSDHSDYTESPLRLATRLGNQAWQQERPPLVSGPSRPQRADARSNRARILDAAEEVFGRGGASASTEDVARLAGVGIGTV